MNGKKREAPERTPQVCTIIIPHLTRMNKNEFRKRIKDELTPGTQVCKVAEYILSNGSITSLDGAIDLGIVDTRKRISDLREKGFDIHDIRRTTKGGASYLEWSYKELR